MSAESKTRRITTSDIAIAAGVSRATVGFVLNDTRGQTISPATRARVLAEAKRLGYRPNSAARALASGRSRIVLLVLPDWPMDFSLRNNIEEASLTLDRAGYALVVFTPHEEGRARPLWEILQPDVVLGLVPFTPDAVEAMRAAGVTRIVPDPETLNVERYADVGPALQVEHLHSLGHRRLVFAGTSDNRLAALSQARYDKANEAARNCGLSPLTRTDIDYRDDSPGLALEGWRDSGATGVVAYNDDVAATVVGEALRAGLKIPYDLAVVGHDDAPIASMLQPRLTTIHVDTAGLGRYFARLAISVIEGVPAPRPACEWEAGVVIRDSTVARADRGSEI